MLSLREKTKEWKEASMDSYIGKFYFGNNNRITRKEEMKIAYDLYNGVFNEKDLKYVTDPYKVDDSFPASLQNYNIIKPKIDLLLGEESKRPMNFRVIQTNEEATTQVQTKYKELLNQAVMEIASRGEENDPITNKEVEELGQVAEYINKDYSDTAETLAMHLLNYLMEKEQLKEKFMVGFHDLMCSSMAIFYSGQSNNSPLFERINPLYFSHDYSPEVKYIEDGEWAVRRMRMTPSAIYDRFYDLMDEKQLKQLHDSYNLDGTGSGDDNEFKAITWRSVPTKDFNEDDTFTGNTVDVWHVTWKSLKKIGFIKYIDEDGVEQEDIVDETYKASPDEKVRWDWATEVWEGWRIGDDLYLGIQPIPEQAISIDNPNGNKLPYSGIVFNNNNTAPKSLVEVMKPLQYMYIVVWYRLEIALARDKGKVLNMDITQIPTSMGVDVNKWLHYLSASGVNFINPYEEGWNVPGREGGKASQFNQFSSQDLTMSDVIVSYINLMQKIEDMIGELSGVSRQRQGQVQSSELVGNVQQTITQSSHITEPLFFAFNQAKKKALNNLLNVAKNVYRNSGKKSLHFFTDDFTRIFMDMSEDFLFADFDIFISDSTKESMDVESLKQLYQPAMQGGASLLDIAEIMTSNNLTDIKNKLTKIEQARQQREKEMQQMQQETQMQAQAMQAQITEAQMRLDAEGLRVKEEDSIRKSETSIQVALIQAESKEDGGAIEDEVEEETAKEKKDSTLKRDQLNETIRHNKATEGISRIQKKSNNTSS
jgi:hypothetical protein